MRSTEERVSYLEAKMDGFSKSLIRLEGAIDALGQRMDRRFDRVESRFYWVLGLQFTILLAVITGLFQIVSKLI